MIRGIYSSNTGLCSSQKSMDALAGNMANMNTPGYKQKNTSIRTFKESMLTVGGKNPVGGITHGAKLASVKTDFETGSFMNTDRKLDYAIDGEGFFTLETADGSLKYTRNGSFQKDEEGYLVDEHGFKVQGEDGAIMLIDGKLDQNFLLTSFENRNKLIKEGENLFIASPDSRSFTDTNSKTKQGFLEASNVDFVKTSTDILNYSKSFTYNSRVLTIQDKILGKAVNEVGNIR